MLDPITKEQFAVWRPPETVSEAPRGGMTLEELDGFFAALACSPQQVPIAESLKLALGADAVGQAVGAAADSGGRQHGERQDQCELSDLAEHRL